MSEVLRRIMETTAGDSPTVWVLCVPTDPNGRRHTPELDRSHLPAGIVVAEVPRLPADADLDVELAEWIPSGYTPIGSGEQIGFIQIANLTDVTPATLRSYHKHEQMPPADGRSAQSPWWWRYTIDEWIRAKRPLRPRRPKSPTEI